MWGDNMTSDEITNIHENIMTAVLQLRQYDKADIWTDDMRETALVLCADLEHYAKRETEYYKMFRDKNKKLLPREK